MKTTILFSSLLTILSGSIAFSQTNSLSVEATVSQPSCFESATGSIEVFPFGAAPYSFTWSTGDNTSSISGLPAGTYSVLITDANSAQYSKTFELIEPQVLKVDGVTENASTFNGSNGSINISLSGVNGGFAFNWTTSNGSGINPAQLNQNHLKAGTYTLAVTNENGCTVEKTFVIQQPYPSLNTGKSDLGSTTVPKVSIYPNPSNGRIEFNNTDEAVRIEIYNNFGGLVKTMNQGSIESVDLQVGSYRAVVYTADSMYNENVVIR